MFFFLVICLGLDKLKVCETAENIDYIKKKRTPKILADMLILKLEILERVEKREEPYFRPDISGHDCPEPLSELIQRCWNDVPEERPGFDIMRSIVRQITR